MSEIDTSPMKLSLKLTEVPVTLERGDGTEVKYVLRELSGKGRDRYLSRMSNRLKYNNAGKPVGMKSFDGLQASLLILCLYNEDDALVTEEELQVWPASAQDALFQKAQEISALNTEGEEEAKND